MIAVGVVSVLLVVVTAANWVGKRRAMRDAAMGALNRTAMLVHGKHCIP